MKKKHVLIMLLFSLSNLKGQIANYVSDGGFEALNSNSVTTLYNVAKFWQPIDTNKGSYYIVSVNSSINPAPNCSYGFQYPRSGNSFALSTFFSNVSFNPDYRAYLRNRLKQPLQPGKTYCVKFYVVNTNNSPLAIDKFEAYFATSILDTITYCNLPLTYLTPQIQNASGIITDTLNWIPITGTFMATGNEKYMVIGDFHAGVNTSTLLINPTYSNTLVNDVYIDDISVIDIDLPAFAGPDIYGIPNNTVYLGRPQDVGIDEACMWYHLPNTTTAIDTAAGITITVAATTQTYMVKQDICGNVKWDTVVVYASGTGLSEQEYIKNSISVYPNPANGFLNIEFNLEQESTFNLIFIYNSLGQVMREEEIIIKNKNALINTSNLLNGVYYLSLKGDNQTTVSKRVVIAR